MALRQLLSLLVIALSTGQLPSLRPHAAKSQRRHSQGWARSLLRAERSSALARVIAVSILSSTAARLSTSSVDNPASGVTSDVEHVARLTEAGRMRPAGIAAVDAAKSQGRWQTAYRGQVRLRAKPNLIFSRGSVPRRPL